MTYGCKLASFVKAAAIAIAIGATASSGIAEVIRLKPSANVEFRQEVRLGDIATVTGDDARQSEQLANTVIIAGADKSTKIRVDDVMLALISQRGAALGQTLQVSGASECLITVGQKMPAAKAVAVASVEPAVSVRASAIAPEAIQGQATPDTAKLAVSNDAILADVIRTRIQQELRIPAEDINVRFDSLSPLLETPIPAARKWMIRPLTRTFLGTVQFEAQLVEGSKVVERMTVQTVVERYQTVPVATAKIGRGDIVAANAVRMERVLLDRKMTTLYGSEKEVVGLEAVRDVELGSMLDNRDFRPAYLTHKNELVTVVYQSGTLAIQMRGRAMGDARLHESLQVRNESTHELYTATVIGKNIAVAGDTLTEEQEKKLREGVH